MSVKYAIAMFVLISSYASMHACILRNVVNNSTRCEILIRSVVIPGQEKLRHPNVIRRRQKNRTEPRIVNTKNQLGLGEYMRLLVTERSPLGKTCKKYRIFVDEKNRQLVLQRKDGCSIGLLEYQTLGYKPIPIDPDHCYLDIYLNDGVNSLYLNVVNDPNAEIEPIKSVMAEQGVTAPEAGMAEAIQKPTQAPQAD